MITKEDVRAVIDKTAALYRELESLADRCDEFQADLADIIDQASEFVDGAWDQLMEAEEEIQ